MTETLTDKQARLRAQGETSMSDPIDLGSPFMCVASKRFDETAAFF